MLPTIGRDGFHTVQVTAPGYGVQKLRLEPKEETPAVQPIELRPVGRIEGRLLADDPTLVANVRIFLDQKDFRGEHTSGLAEVTTDALGQFEVAEFAEGPVQILIRTEPDATQLPRIPEGNAVFVGDATVVEIPYERAVRVEGRVQTKPGGDPVADTLVSVQFGSLYQGAQVRSDVEGRFAANVLPGEVRQQLISRPPEFKNWIEESASWQHPVKLPGGVETFRLPPIELVRTIPRLGRILDAIGNPIGKMRVGAVKNNRVYGSAISNDEGAFELQLPSDLEVEKYSVHGPGTSDPRRAVFVKQASPLILQLEE